jgi:hypothetical protein
VAPLREAVPGLCFAETVYRQDGAGGYGLRQLTDVVVRVVPRNQRSTGGCLSARPTSLVILSDRANSGTPWMVRAGEISPRVVRSMSAPWPSAHRPGCPDTAC